MLYSVVTHIDKELEAKGSEQVTKNLFTDNIPAFAPLDLAGECCRNVDSEEGVIN